MRKALPVVLALILGACSLPSQGGSPTTPAPSALTINDPALQPRKPAQRGAEASRPTILPAAATNLPLAMAPEVLPVPPALRELPGVVLIWDGAAQGHEFRPIMAASGDLQPGREPLMLSQAHTFTKSPDGSLLVGVTASGERCEPANGGTRCFAVGNQLHLIDLRSWRDRSVPLSTEAWFDRPIFSPDSAQIALPYSDVDGGGLLLLDATSGALLGLRVLPLHPRLVTFTPQGLAVYGRLDYAAPEGTPTTPRVLLLDPGTLEVTWDQPLEEVLDGMWCIEECVDNHGMQLYAQWQPAIVPAPDGQLLYIVHADAERLTTVDFAERSLRSAPLQSEQSALEQILDLFAQTAEAKGGSRGAIKSAVLSPDGARLYVVGQTLDAVQNPDGFWESKMEPQGLQVIDVAGGTRLAEADSTAGEVSISLDGARLYLHGWGTDRPWTEVWESDGLKRLARLDDWDVRVRQGPAGQALLLAIQVGETRTRFALVDPLSFTPYQPWELAGYAEWVAP